MRFLSLVFVCVALFAHEMWIDANLTLHYGHSKSSKHQGVKEIAYDLSKISKVLCEDQQLIRLDPPKDYPLHVDRKCKVLLVEMDNGYYTKTPYGLKNLPKKSVDMTLKSWRSIERAKFIAEASPDPLDDGLEITLSKLPAKGQKARLQIFYEKKPIKGVVVAYDGRTRGVSDENGRVNIKIRRSGLQHISATLRYPCAQRDLCDQEVVTETLSFEVR